MKESFDKSRKAASQWSYTPSVRTADQSALSNLPPIRLKVPCYQRSTNSIHSSDASWLYLPGRALLVRLHVHP
jgi:hypothetical protein